MRLQKYLAECGVASRRKAETLISAERVRVNGAVAKLGDCVDPDQDEVSFDGNSVTRNAKVYIVLHKPKGVVTSVGDTHSRKTVLDCVTGVERRLFPVGRLDLDVSGVLLMTNDGELAYRLTHPKYGVKKTYVAWVEGEVETSAIERLCAGVQLEDGPTAPARASVAKKTGGNTLLRIEIHEGRKRIVKRMCAAIGHPVRDLRRVAVANIRCENLVPGEWRYLNQGEIQSLNKITGLTT